MNPSIEKETRVENRKTRTPEKSTGASVSNQNLPEETRAEQDRKAAKLQSDSPESQAFVENITESQGDQADRAELEIENEISGRIQEIQRKARGQA